MHLRTHARKLALLPGMFRFFLGSHNFSDDLAVVSARRGLAHMGKLHCDCNEELSASMRARTHAHNLALLPGLFRFFLGSCNFCADLAVVSAWRGLAPMSKIQCDCLEELFASMRARTHARSLALLPGMFRFFLGSSNSCADLAVVSVRRGVAHISKIQCDGLLELSARRRARTHSRHLAFLRGMLQFFPRIWQFLC